MQSFIDLFKIEYKPKNTKEEIEFTNILRTIYNRHNPTMISVAGGVAELKAELGKSLSDITELPAASTLKQHLDQFYMNRICMRTVSYINLI